MARLADLSDAARHDLESMMEYHFNALTQRLALLEGEPSYDEANASLLAFGEHLQGLFHQKPAPARRARRKQDGEEGAQDEGRKGG